MSNPLPNLYVPVQIPPSQVFYEDLDFRYAVADEYEDLAPEIKALFYQVPEIMNPTSDPVAYHNLLYDLNAAHQKFKRAFYQKQKEQPSSGRPPLAELIQLTHLLVRRNSYQKLMLARLMIS